MYRDSNHPPFGSRIKQFDENGNTENPGRSKWMRDGGICTGVSLGDLEDFEAELLRALRKIAVAGRRTTAARELERTCREFRRAHGDDLGFAIFVGLARYTAMLAEHSERRLTLFQHCCAEVSTDELLILAVLWRVDKGLIDIAEPPTCILPRERKSRERLLAAAGELVRICGLANGRIGSPPVRSAGIGRTVDFGNES